MPKIEPSEFAHRIEKSAEEMVKLGIDCVLLFPGPGFTYFTGLKFARERYRIVVAIVGSNGNLTIMGPNFEEEKLNSSPLKAAVETWSDEEDQYARIADLIFAAHGKKPAVGLELTTDYYHLLGLQRAMPGATFEDSLKTTDELRAIKSRPETECLREAAARTGARMAKVPSRLVEGMTEKEMSRLFGPGGMIQFGLTASSPNSAAGLRKLEARDVVVIDAGDWVEGYRSDLTRTFLFGEPTKRMLEVYRVVNDAELAAIEAAKPGEPASVIDTAARAVIEKAGFGEYFTHRGGHGLGLAFHEIPICAKGSPDILKPGMVLTAEPGIYLPGEFGIRLEDDILITETGNELLSERGPLYV